MAAATQDSVLKATLTIQEPRAGGTRDIDRFEFPFNPKEWSITHGAEWKLETTKKGAPPAEFKGSKPASASVEIFLDESDREDGDISTIVERLRKVTGPEEQSVQKNRPSAPHVLFEWGSAITFKGYVDSLVVKYTMFRGTGTPIRGTCTLSMKEFPIPREAQNPTSGGASGHRTHRVVAGESLALVAHAEYGDPGLWRLLAAANGIDDPIRVADGVLLEVPPL